MGAHFLYEFREILLHHAFPDAVYIWGSQGRSFMDVVLSLALQTPGNLVGVSLS